MSVSIHVIIGQNVNGTNVLTFSNLIATNIMKCLDTIQRVTFFRVFRGSSTVLIKCRQQRLRIEWRAIFFVVDGDYILGHEVGIHTQQLWTLVGLP